MEQHPNMTTSMSPTQLAMVAEASHPTGYGMSGHGVFPQSSPYMSVPFPQPHFPVSPTNPRKRRISDVLGADTAQLPRHIPLAPSGMFVKQPDADLMQHLGMQAALDNPAQPHHNQNQHETEHLLQPSLTESTEAPRPARKKTRVNTPWTPAEEQLLKKLRDEGLSWGDIAKDFPGRTEGGVKKHWYKDMHYAEFAENESVALLHAIREYEQSKWKVIGQKVGKPAKACEQYAREHFTRDEIAGKVKPTIPSKEIKDSKDILDTQDIQETQDVQDVLRPL